MVKWRNGGPSNLNSTAAPARLCCHMWHPRLKCLRSQCKLFPCYRRSLGCWLMERYHCSTANVLTLISMMSRALLIVPRMGTSRCRKSSSCRCRPRSSMKAYRSCCCSYHFLEHFSFALTLASSSLSILNSGACCASLDPQQLGTPQGPLTW